jgi:hypothetical protein
MPGYTHCKGRYLQHWIVLGSFAESFVMMWLLRVRAGNTGRKSWEQQPVRSMPLDRAGGDELGFTRLQIQWPYRTPGQV